MSYSYGIPVHARNHYARYPHLPDRSRSADRGWHSPVSGRSIPVHGRVTGGAGRVDSGGGITLKNDCSQGVSCEFCTQPMKRKREAALPVITEREEILAKTDRMSFS